METRKSSNLTNESSSLPPDHIGIHLNRAYGAWLSRFIAAMNDAGHDWFTQSRANVMGCLDRESTRQSTLLDRTGMTKQALQQSLDGLERHGVITRLKDPNDKRGRLVDLTDKGRQALADADRIKLEIEADYRESVGGPEMQRLSGLLVALVQA